MVAYIQIINYGLSRGRLHDMIPNMLSREKIDQILFDIMASIYRFERKKVQLFGINYEAFYLLFLLRKRSNVRIREIALEMDIHISTASRAVNRLEKRGLVARKKDPEDKRSILVSLEPEGEKVVKASEDHSYRIIKKNMEGMKEEDAEAIVTTALQFSKILEVPSVSETRGELTNVLEG
jgi:DNA-binding MarR family transcriptional regulator